MAPQFSKQQYTPVVIAEQRSAQCPYNRYHCKVVGMIPAQIQHCLAVALIEVMRMQLVVGSMAIRCTSLAPEFGRCVQEAGVEANKSF